MSASTMSDELREVIARIYAEGYIDGLQAKRHRQRDNAVGYMLKMLPRKGDYTEWMLIQELLDAVYEVRGEAIDEYIANVERGVE